MNKNSFLRKIRSVAVTVIALAVPAVFAEDAYIESDGTQFINTGYYVKPTTKLVLNCAIANWEASMVVTTTARR